MRTVEKNEIDQHRDARPTVAQTINNRPTSFCRAFRSAAFAAKENENNDVVFPKTITV